MCASNGTTRCWSSTLVRLVLGGHLGIDRTRGERLPVIRLQLCCDESRIARTHTWPRCSP
jgi:hypothetical protein